MWSKSVAVPLANLLHGKGRLIKSYLYRGNIAVRQSDVFVIERCSLRFFERILVNLVSVTVARCEFLIPKRQNGARYRYGDKALPFNQLADTRRVI